MNFAEKIYKQISKTKTLSIGEVKLDRAWLYGKDYEVFISKINKRKILEVRIYKKEDKELVFSKKGTLSHILSVASGYVLNN